MSIKTKNWYAWMDGMPPKPSILYVVGDVYVENPGIEAKLSVRGQQGANSTTLLLDLHLIQKSGMWPQIMTWEQAKFDKAIVPDSEKYNQVDVFLDNKLVCQIVIKETY